MEKQLLGSTVALPKNYPLHMEQSGKRPLVDSDHASQHVDLQMTPSDNFTSPGPHQHNFKGSMHNPGSDESTAPLNHTPIKGWTSASTPMSHRSHAQSK